MHYKQFIKLTKDFPQAEKQGLRKMMCCGNCDKYNGCKLKDNMLSIHEVCDKWKVSESNYTCLD
jgi:hypothetical protein